MDVSCGEPADVPRHGEADDLERERLFRRCIVAITAIGGAWRIIVLVSKWHVPLRFGDAWYYSIQALNNGNGKWFREASGPFQYWGVRPGAEHPPLTSIVATPAGLLRNPEFWQRATMTLLGIIAIVAVAHLGRRIGGRRVGVLAALLAAVYPNIWLSDALIMSETLSMLLVVAVLLVALAHRQRFSLRSAAALGALIGVCGHARSEFLLYAVLFALIGVRTQTRARWAGRASLMLLATALTVTPWIAYNTHRFHATVLMSTNEGSTWLGANCPATYGGPGMGGWNLLCIDDGSAPDEDSAQRSVRRRHEAFAYARAHIARLPLVVAARVLRGADLFRVQDNVRADVGEDRPVWAIWLGMACWWVLAPIGALGLWRTRRGVRGILLVPVIGVVVVTVAFYGSHRLRAPLEPVMVIGAASFLATLGPVPRATEALVRRGARKPALRR